ncbi:jg11937 [Pararge aegeria aegeria]|uniref:Jg11937 protein n=1 Tax=Pararge aegeria aegeria TaxID=348720 RepID=A0A8S4S7J4_9NEOP|nr:jg11937 [Pararge aegeria aegeria]
MEAERAFQILAVRIRNEVAKRFVHVRGYRPRRDADPYGASWFDGDYTEVCRAIQKSHASELATYMLLDARSPRAVSIKLCKCVV